MTGSLVCLMALGGRRVDQVAIERRKWYTTKVI